MKIERISDWALGCLLGLAGTVAVAGVRPLNPTNIAWLAESDPLKDYLSWAFYRHAPWGLPLGANPNFGLEKLGSSILFSDSIPLCAFLFKCFRWVLPDPFQYFGIWIVLSFVLQGYFAMKLLRLATNDRVAQFSGALLFVFAPPLMMRVGVHHDLVEQWVLLAALWLTFRRPGHGMFAWALLVAVTALSHPYLLAMVLAMWAADWSARWLAGPDARRLLIGEGALMMAAWLIPLWQAGAFLIGHGLGREGFAYYRMNANALLNPRVDSVSRWSYVMPALPGVSFGEYEGFSFMGLGALACAAAACATVPKHRDRVRAAFRSRWIPLWIAVLLLTAFALSNQVSISSSVVTYHLPQFLVDGLSAFRASGRFFLPVFYLILFLCIVQLTASLPRRLASVLLIGFAIIQIADTSAGWLPRRQHLAAHYGRTLASPLRDPFWWQSARFYHTLHMVRWAVLRDDWAAFAIYADNHRMGTDSVYLTRVDDDRLAAVEHRQMEQLSRGEFEPTSLYILDPEVAAMVAKRINPTVDLLTSVDGFFVLAPRWHVVRPERH